MRAAYIASEFRPRKLARRDRNGHPAIKASRRRALLLPPLEELLRQPAERRTVTGPWEAA